MAGNKSTTTPSKDSPKQRKRIGGLLKLRAGKQTGQASGNLEKSRRFHIFPKILRNAWAEIRQVTWPGRKETFRLTIAVLIFSIIFGAFVAALDYGLGKLFKEVILG